MSEAIISVAHDGKPVVGEAPKPMRGYGSTMLTGHDWSDFEAIEREVGRRIDAVNHVVPCALTRDDFNRIVDFIFNRRREERLNP